MELLIFRPEEFNKLYNCSYDIEQVPLEVRSHPLVGYSLIVLALIFEIYYIPCIWVIYTQMKKSSCYKLMFYIGVCDVTCMPIIGFVTGYFTITGAVACSHLKLMYILGSIAPELWYAESFAAVLLALNRCLDLNYPKFGEKIFYGTRTWKLLAVPTIYAICIGVFFKTAFFNGILCSWFFNPHIGYVEDPENKYSNIMHPIHNWSMAICLATLYGVFSLSLACKVRKLRKGSQDRAVAKQSNLNQAQKKLFLQVLLISLIHCFTAVVYDLMQLVSINQVWTISAQLAWLSAHGAPGIIYCSLNETVRKGCCKLLGLTKTGSRVGHIYQLRSGLGTSLDRK
ncbi:serpentine type 7TM GPCR chemoreceptor srt domain-containing protein [Ditylenchus destructor]|nr:serpentine type 7TM GPCR chemoreceptor srt domain-containing protein [Ditylenchus destructor]